MQQLPSDGVPASEEAPPSEVLASPPRSSGEELPDAPEIQPVPASPAGVPDWRLLLRQRRYLEEMQRTDQEIQQSIHDIKMSRKQLKREREQAQVDHVTVEPERGARKRPVPRRAEVDDAFDVQTYRAFKRSVTGCLKRYSLPNSKKKAVLYDAAARLE